MDYVVLIQQGFPDEEVLSGMTSSNSRSTVRENLTASLAFL